MNDEPNDGISSGVTLIGYAVRLAPLRHRVVGLLVSGGCASSDAGRAPVAGLGVKEGCGGLDVRWIDHPSPAVQSGWHVAAQHRPVHLLIGHRQTSLLVNHLRENGNLNHRVFFHVWNDQTVTYPLHTRQSRDRRRTLQFNVSDVELPAHFDRWIGHNKKRQLRPNGIGVRFV